MGQIVSTEYLIELRQEWRREPKRLVLAAGAFDLLHPGHIRLLEQARSLGDVLVVAVEDDAAVRAAAERERGKDSPRAASLRPAFPLEERAEILAALASVDFVTELRDLPVDAWVEHLQPDIYVRGGGALEAKRTQTASDDKTDASGPALVSIPLEPGYSTAQLIDRIQQSRQ